MSAKFSVPELYAPVFKAIAKNSTMPLQNLSGHRLRGNSLLNLFAMAAGHAGYSAMLIDGKHNRGSEPNWKSLCSFIHMHIAYKLKIEQPNHLLNLLISSIPADTSHSHTSTSMSNAGNFAQPIEPADTSHSHTSPSMSNAGNPAQPMEDVFPLILKQRSMLLIKNAFDVSGLDFTDVAMEANLPVQVCAQICAGQLPAKETNNSHIEKLMDVFGLDSINPFKPQCGIKGCYVTEDLTTIHHLEEAHAFCQEHSNMHILDIFGANEGTRFKHIDKCSNSGCVNAGELSTLRGMHESGFCDICINYSEISQDEKNDILAMEKYANDIDMSYS
jgi:hypothetical protein